MIEDDTVGGTDAFDDRNKNSIQFWQREAHYYQVRAGGQGAAAIRLVSLAGLVVGAAAALASRGQSTPFLWGMLIVPVVILLIFAVIVRHFHEMNILRAYFAYAEFQLRNLTSSNPLYEAWIPWDAYVRKLPRDAPLIVPSESGHRRRHQLIVGAHHDAPVLITIVWAVSVLLIGGVGVVALPWWILTQLAAPDGVTLLVVGFALLLLVAAILAMTMENPRHERQMRDVLASRELQSLLNAGGRDGSADSA
ncbi:hypothetical protein ACFY5A_12980 [Microbacterium sp. NPDC012755]|uniref:hypothetical protein n=1 Tax=Microbacterium sp. NPDC012755 TaxID=3364184 RepID=UPI0036C0A234